jgi:thiol-disulfide isomerase/thioredoxin
MFRNILYIVFSMLFVAACSSCAPSLVDDEKDTSENNDEYSFVTWDSCSQNFGDHPCNFTLKDQEGNDVSLYDYYGDTIVIDFSAMWCGPCRSAAAEVQEVKDAYEASGFTYLTVLVETSQGKAPDSTDCKDWADTYGISEPVLAGSRDMIDYNGEHGWPIQGWPTFFFITDEMVLNTSLRGFSSSYIDSLIQDTMGE